MMIRMSTSSSAVMSAAVVLALLFSFGSCHQGRLDDSDVDQSSYTFERYIEEFGKVYKTKQEREYRKNIFESNLEHITTHNSNIIKKDDPENNNDDGGYHYSLRVNEWTDRRIPEELPLGLSKKRKNGPFEEFLSFQQQDKKSSKVQEQYQHWLENDVIPVSDLPKEVDWRTHTNPKIITPVKNQGFCGSCWAFASTEVLESHIALKTGQLFTLSPQELVSCVTNPQHCGGSGGCQGAIYELAFEYVMENGMVLEKDFPYKSRNGQCTLTNTTTTSTTMDGSSSPLLLRGKQQRQEPAADIASTEDDNNYIDGAVATIEGYWSFPSNNYTVLMNAVATLGPIGVTVAASRWSFYGGGVFKLPNHNSHDATDVNHAVVLEGYGIDSETQEPYWLVRNSWGPNWGEGGYIRLYRVDPSTVPDFDKDDCGIDKTPADGSACTKDKNGNDIDPQPVKVCGTTAILYETFAPVGGRLLPTRHADTQSTQQQ